MIEIPATHRDLLDDKHRAFAFLATVVVDGTPQVTVVWFIYKDGYFLINSALGRTKDRNMRERPAVALAIPDPTNMYRFIQVRGRVVEITKEGATDHINFLSHKYNGVDYPLTPGQVRVIYKIEPDSVTVNG
ncbi:MAG TPA: TIGR03618 family F420-dependent PPOX class oxidoreductase [Anaerolineaceae bacterium]|nr:TIGR03618 family F420-dependent PPOX class oxidoreductase [Anaerolineaceae bacterium]